MQCSEYYRSEERSTLCTDSLTLWPRHHYTDPLHSHALTRIILLGSGSTSARRMSIMSSIDTSTHSRGDGSGRNGERFGCAHSCIGERTKERTSERKCTRTPRRAGGGGINRQHRQQQQQYSSAEPPRTVIAIHSHKNSDQPKNNQRHCLILHRLASHARARTHARTHARTMMDLRYGSLGRPSFMA